MTLEEAQDSAIIVQAFAALARAGSQETAKAALAAFDRFKTRYYQYKPPEPEYDGRNGVVKVNSQ